MLGDFPGMTFAPRFSPDGSQRGAEPLAQNGNTDIYASICAPGSATPADQRPRDRHLARPIRRTAAQIVFNSDRGGSQQLYVMGADGGDAQRISFGDGPLRHARSGRRAAT